MGYWEQNEQGHSFAERDDADKEPLIWGDQPADAVDNAIQQIVAVFVKDIGRLPSRAEMMAGLTFSTAVLSLPDRPEDSPEVSEEDIEVVANNYYAAFHHERPQDTRLPAWYVEAGQQVREVLHRLKEPFEKPQDDFLPPHEGL
jgi:hypothetical protein